MPDHAHVTDAEAADAADVLAVAAVHDNREPSEIAAREWALAFRAMGITAQEAAAAVRVFYIEHPDSWVKPGHLRPIVAAYRARHREHSAVRAAIEAPERDGVVPAERGVARIRQALAAARARQTAQEDPTP